MRLLLVATNVVAGFTAIALTLRTVQFRRVFSDAEKARAP
jgi:hypothetical protein